MQVKGLTAAGVKAGTASQQQLRQFTIQHQLLQQRKAQQQQQTKTSQLAQVIWNKIIYREPNLIDCYYYFDIL